jgi:hypothetical protein
VTNEVIRRLENLEVSRKLLESDVVEVKGNVHTILTNHLPHLQDALAHLVMKSWVNLVANICILITALISLYMVVKH